MKAKELSKFLENVPDEADVLVNTVTGTQRSNSEHDQNWRDLETHCIRIECQPITFVKDEEK